MKLFSLVIFFFTYYNLFAEDVAAKKFFTGKTQIENPEKVRDPFAMNTYEGAQVGSGAGLQKQISNNFTNVKSQMVTSLYDLKIVGVIIGPQKKAIAKVGEGTLILYEGMKLGPEQAELKAILSGGVIFVERIVNIYGEEEYLETVIPVTLN